MQNDTILGLILAGTCLGLFTVYVVGLLRFAAARKAEAEAPDGVKTHAGGDLIIQGGKTYYIMPSGQRRKIADKALDLRPGSPDMLEWTRVLERAYAEHMADKDEEHKQTVKTMREVAKEAVRG